MMTSVMLVACGDSGDEPDDTEDEGLQFNPSVQTSDEQTTEPPASTAAVTKEPVSYTFTDADETVYVQNCVQANLRTTPDSSAASKGVVDFGKSYKRVKFNDVWSALEIDGEIFYINTYFLTTSPNEVVFKDTEVKKLYVTNVDPNTGELGSLFLRTFTSTSPDTEYHPNGNVGAVAKHGAPLEVTGISTDGNWYRVNFTFTDENGKTKTEKNLYVWNGKYVTEVDPATTTDAQ